MAKALIVVDMLNDFLLEGAPLFVPGAPAIVPAVKARLEASRRAGDLVVFVCDCHDADDQEFQRFPPHAISETSGAEIIAELAPAPGEVVIAKRRFDPFFETELHDLLVEHGLDHATVVGVCTHICVMETVAGLSHRDIPSLVPRDSVADFDADQAEAALARMQNVYGAQVE